MRVFISSPYTIGDVALNVRAQIDAANELMNLGHIPFLPLLSHFQHMIHPRPYQEWLNNDLEWLAMCDCVLRLPGDSKGADIECETAKKLGKPIYHKSHELPGIFNKQTTFKYTDGI